MRPRRPLPPKPGAGSQPPGMAVADVPPKVRYRTESEAANYARRADRLTVRNEDGDVVAIIEIVSPGNKDSKHALRQFTRKAVQYLHEQGRGAWTHELVVTPVGDRWTP